MPTGLNSTLPWIGHSAPLSNYHELLTGSVPLANIPPGGCQIVKTNNMANEDLTEGIPIPVRQLYPIEEVLRLQNLERRR